MKKKNPLKSEPSTPAQIRSTEAKTVVLDAQGRPVAEAVEHAPGNAPEAFSHGEGSSTESVDG